LKYKGETMNSIRWIKTEDRQITPQDFHKQLLIRYSSPEFPGRKVKKENFKTHIASGEVCASNSTQGKFDKPRFFFTGIAGHPSIELDRIIEYIFI